jgi:purine-binding chemotaxis protein CheW
MGRKRAFEAGLAGLFSFDQTYHLDAQGPSESDRSQVGPAEGADPKGQVSMKSSQVKPVTNKATEELVATQDDQVESIAGTASEQPAAIEVAGADGPLASDPEEGSGGPSARPVDGSTVHLVVFALGDEQYGVGIDAVDSIIRPKSITAVPRAPDFVEGVTNLRGTVLPVVDLHRRFGLPGQDATKDTRIIVAESGGNKVGMMVDAVLEVRRVPEAAIEPPSPLVAAIDSAFITGIAKVGDGRLIILLDLGRVLARE